jgi:site-specific recombinase XerD
MDGLFDSAPIRLRPTRVAHTSALGIEDSVFHDLRRRGATRLGDAGANAFHIAAILGHEGINTSQIYTVRRARG